MEAFLGIDALVAEVVDREHGGRAGEAAFGLAVAQEDRGESGGPVVGVQDLGEPADLAAERERSPAEEGEAPRVVRVVGHGLIPVDPVPAEEPLVVEKVDLRRGSGEIGSVHPGPLLALAEPDAEGPRQGLELGAVDAVVAGEN